jgi:cysteine-rich repeat protein
MTGICTDDSFNPIDGCSFTANDVGCDDGNACTLDEACSNGWRLSIDLIACGDGNPCTDDTYDPAAGCTITDNNAPCDDENACTVGDVCGNGSCQPGADPAPCNDGEFCNEVETCEVDTGCVPGVPVNVDDGVGCTIDSCDEVNDAVAHTLSTAECNIPDDAVCLSAVCDPQAGCTTIVVPNCCGNGIVEGNEGCDDQNADDGDGCTAECVQTSVEYGPVHTFNGHQAQLYIGIGQGSCSVGSLGADATYFCEHFYNASCTPKPGYFKTSTNANQEWVMHKNGGCTSNGEDIPGKQCQGGPCKIGMLNENLQGLKGLVCVCDQ